MYKYILSKKIIKFLKNKEFKFIKKFYNFVTIISKDPYNNNLDIKQLKWKKDSYRLRIGKYRFLYEIKENQILIYFYDADSRWWVYK